jgi:hypothetical protein
MTRRAGLRIGNLLSTLLLLAAFAPQAEATWATGGTMTNYTDRRSVAWGARASAKQQGDKP